MIKHLITLIKRIMGLSIGFIVLLVVLIVITKVWYTVYTGLVYENLVFTSELLPVSSVSWYKVDAVYADAMKQYGIEWGVFLTEGLDVITPWEALVCYLLAYGGIKGAPYLLRGLLFITGGVALFRYAYRIFSYGACEWYGQLCRSLNPADSTGKFHTTNYIWDIIFWNNLAQLVLITILIWITWDLEERASKDAFEDEKRVLYQSNVPPEKIEAYYTLQKQKLLYGDSLLPVQPPPPPPPQHQEPPVQFMVPPSESNQLRFRGDNNNKQQ